MKFRLISGLTLLTACATTVNADEHQRTPNIIFIMSDDHSAQAVSAYHGILSEVLPTPNIDRIGKEGMRLECCYATNSISTPSRGAIMTGQYSNKNKVYTLEDHLDPSSPNVAKELKANGYQTAIVGKWHLHAEPTGFDWYNVFPAQGRYYNPILIEKGNWGADPSKEKGFSGKEYAGHSSDVVADQAIRFMNERDRHKPFFLMCHFKAPHRHWNPAERFKDLLKDKKIPEPENILDNYKGKGHHADLLELCLEDMNKWDVKHDIPQGLTQAEMRHWVYQYYIKDYLRCIAGVDENVGRILQYLDEHELTENTIVIYTSDQGFFLGEHGWFDKRLMYEESIRMPFLIRYPKEIRPETVNRDIILNIDFAPTFLDFAGVKKPSYMQGESFRENLSGHTSRKWRKAMYYRYWQNADIDHNVTAHFGIRTQRYKLIYFYGETLGMPGTKNISVKPKEWELYDVIQDPKEMNNLYGNPEYEKVVKKLKAQLKKLRAKYEDEDKDYPVMKEILEDF